MSLITELNTRLNIDAKIAGKLNRAMREAGYVAGYTKSEAFYNCVSFELSMGKSFDQIVAHILKINGITPNKGE